MIDAIMASARPTEEEAESREIEGKRLLARSSQ
jgi:hypothetical protein